jgi:diaminopimelate decarboxylase
MSVALPEASATPNLGGLDPDELASRFGTPLYVYDFDVIATRVAALRDALPDGFDLAYAVKANPSLGVVAQLARLGLGADVASGGELATALRAGIDPGRIVFTGPGKRDDELEAAVRAGIRAVTVESIGELRRLDDVASRLETTTPVLLRVAVAGRPETTGVAVGRADGGKFGIDLEDLTEAAVVAAQSHCLRPLGLHAFGASNVLDADALADHVEWTVGTAAEMTRRLRAETGISSALELVDIGGGLGIPYRDEDRELDLARLGYRLARLASAWSVSDETRGTRILMEPGRFLVGPAGTYLTRVVDTKRIAGRELIIVDGGIHHLVRPALVGGSHRIVNLSTPDPRRSRRRHRHRIAGARRPARRPRHRRLRLHRIDAPLPVAPGPGRDRDQWWAGWPPA